MLLRGIEGIPVIIRFKTTGADTRSKLYGSIEGIPVIIRFKTSKSHNLSFGFIAMY